MTEPKQSPFRNPPYYLVSLSRLLRALGQISQIAVIRQKIDPLRLGIRFPLHERHLPGPAGDKPIFHGPLIIPTQANFLEGNQFARCN